MYGSEGSSYINLINAFGEDVYLIHENKAKDGDNQAFSIGYRIGDNEEICIELLTHDWSNAGANLIGFSGNDMYWLNVPVSIDDAATLCDSSSDIIDFFFDVDVNSSRWKNSIAECSIANGGC